MLKRALSVVVFLFLSTPVFAQTLGTITGEVKDSSGGAIPGATVTVQNTGTNLWLQRFRGQHRRSLYQ